MSDGDGSQHHKEAKRKHGGVVVAATLSFAAARRPLLRQFSRDNVNRGRGVSGFHIGGLAARLGIARH